jgi:hypothetical protein
MTGPAGTADITINTRNFAAVATDTIQYPSDGYVDGGNAFDPGTWTETTTTVPEPSTLMMLGIGLLGLVSGAIWGFCPLPTKAIETLASPALAD